MKIDVSAIVKSVNKERQEAVSLEMESFESRLGSFPITVMSPIVLTIANHENKELTIRGSVELETRMMCDRCLTDVRTPVHFDIDKALTIREDGLVDEEMEETDYLIGFELDVDKLVYAEILVNWPMKVLCKDDCKGICKVCGKNLNKGACNCQKTELDPRMAAIQDVFNKFKEV